jgi:3-oxoacyl-[acyl-carrier protein] reductase
MTGRLDGKVALVTGAGGALGGATAARFAKEGAAVVLQDVAEAAVLAQVRAIESAGGRAMARVCDVTDAAAIEAMFDDATATFGAVDVLVNCAGTSGSNDPKDPAVGPIGISDEDWQRLLAIHLNGSFYCTRAMIRRLLGTGRSGSVICISSIAGLSGWGDVHYSTAKGGLLGFVSSIARMYGGQGIRANAVCPGVIDAGMTNAVPRELIEPMIMMTPLQRAGTAEDIADACLYLASDEASFVTGQWLSPNGGFVIG